MSTLPQIFVKINFSYKRAAIVITTFALINLWMLLGTWLFTIYFREDLSSDWQSGSVVKYFLVQFHLGTENVIASWYSSMLLLLVSLGSVLCFVADRKYNQSHRDRYLSYGWLCFALIFALLSLDELGSFHERIGMIAAFNPSGERAVGWVAVLAIPIGLVALFMLTFGWMHIRRSLLAFGFAIAGIACFIVNPFLERMQMSIVGANREDVLWQIHDASLIIEEGLEIFGVLCFLTATALYAIFISRQGDRATIAVQASTNFTLKLKTALVGTSLFIGLVGLAAIAVEWVVQNTESGDTGIAKNWFPAVLAMLVSLFCLQIWNAIPRKKIFHRLPYLTLALFSLFLCMYYGANIYSYMYWGAMIVPGHWIHLVLLTIAIVLGIKLALQVENLWSRVGIVAWILFLGLGMKSGINYAAPLVFIAFACLLLSLLPHLYRWQHLPEFPIAETQSFQSTDL